ncbi:hypothetical protein SAMN05192558_11264 [Actinokineospora alba]|uniref:Tryptophan-associated transmembrane protein (Trp_oprn_chp) n=1 Tax=Actinokineospora alba TaxID=504798 RepID=A0A1H0UV33_9PSEU|nr:hypothetical protein [Actinokineospora alba]TDP69064.1 hypothetical protein C8E96_4635 [Actinokineospora alba]SDI78675.1 hypothetical protein SAMN05421871_107340 [Actinokineospora alba]SDP69646.1 hypothetical protein SAMN05192558_11264 [Actinokineospora alba]
MASVDRTGRFSPLEWVGILAGLGALVISFFPWQRVTGQFADMVEQIGFRTTSTAWSSGPVAWLAVLALFLAAALLLARAFGVRLPGGSVVWLLLAVTAVVLVIIRWVTLPDLDPARLALLNLKPEDVETNAGPGLFLCLGIAIVSMAAAVARIRTAGRPAARTAPVRPPAGAPAAERADQDQHPDR